MNKRLIIAGTILATVTVAALAYRFVNSRDQGGMALSGNVEVTEVNVAFKIPGRVTTLFTDEGRQVRAGDKIALLDNAEYVAQVAQSRAVLDTSKAQFEKAKNDYARTEMLFKKEVMSAQQMDAAKTAYDVALAQIQQSNAALRTSEVRLRDAVLYAPVSGVVLRKNVEAGETVSAGTPIFTIGNLENPWIKVYVKEDKLGLVKLGQKALISTDTYPGKVYDGVVTFISSEAEFTPKNVQTKEERVKLVFGVKVSVKNVNDELKPSMPADVKFLVNP
jgi:HlyD family secretion protein